MHKHSAIELELHPAARRDTGGRLFGELLLEERDRFLRPTEAGGERVRGGARRIACGTLRMGAGSTRTGRDERGQENGGA